VADIARTTDVIHICVVYNEQVTDVVLGEGGILANGRSGQILIVHSTVGPKFMQDCAQAAKAKGIDLIDAAVSGSRPRSIDGTLTLMLGGEASVVNYCMPLFRVVGKHIFHVGDVGAGQAVKLVNNVMAAVHRLIYLEALSIAAAYGVDESSVNAAVSVSTGMSWWQMNMAVFDDRIKSHAYMGIDELPYRFSKDIPHAIEIGNDKRLSLPLTALSAQIAPAMFSKRFESVLGKSREGAKSNKDGSPDEATQKADVRHARIGYIGVGDMGGPMAVNLAKAGFTVNLQRAGRRCCARRGGATGEWSAWASADRPQHGRSEVPAGLRSGSQGKGHSPH
jgi:3-hydroxyisobutyrate dehydrogenase-like beta-hydroxyacid dehydrogenase